MEKRCHKLFWAWEFEKEERWLNAMADQGWCLSQVGGLGSYVFQKGEPGAYAYRLEMLNHWPSHPESVRYIEFVEGTGAEYVGMVNRWVYFRKRTEDGGFDLFSDLDSRIAHLNRVLTLITVILIFLAFNTLNMVNMFFSSHYEASLVMGGLTGLLGLLVAWGCVRVLLVRRRLGRERALRE